MIDDPFANLNAVVLRAVARNVGARRLVEVQGVRGPRLRQLIDQGRVIALDLEAEGETPAAELEMVAAWLDELEALAEAEGWGWQQVVERSGAELAMRMLAEFAGIRARGGLRPSREAVCRRVLLALTALDRSPQLAVGPLESSSAARRDARAVVEAALAEELGRG